MIKKVDSQQGIQQAKDRVKLLDFILSHKKEYLQDFLQSRDLTYYGTKKDLRNRLNENLDSGTITETELIELLDRIEGYGNQHVYLYTNNSDSYLQQLRDERFIRSRLERFGVEDMYNQNQSLLLLETPTIGSIMHNSRLLSIRWVEKRRWYEHLHDERDEDHELLIKTYGINSTRGMTTFRVDLITGNSELMIQRLPRGTNYEEIKEEYIGELDELIGFDTFSLLETRSAIKRIEESNEAERRALNYETTAGGKISFKSRSRGVDYRVDSGLNKSRLALGQNIFGQLGNFYWLPNEHIGRKIHTHIYKDRVGIFGECTQQEVNYVLSKVRQFASGNA